MKLPLRLWILLPGRAGTTGFAFVKGGDLTVSTLPVDVADRVFERLSPDNFLAGRAGTCGFGRSGTTGALRSVEDVLGSDNLASGGEAEYFVGLAGTPGATIRPCSSPTGPATASNVSQKKGTSWKYYLSPAPASAAP